MQKPDILHQRMSLMRSLVFEGNTWEKYEDLRSKDKILHRNLRKILKEMLRNDPSKGLGKPERLKHTLSGLWSRRLSKGDRLIYTFDTESIHILAIGGHYITPAMVNRNNIVIARREERTTKSKIPYCKSGQSPKGISIKEIASSLHSSR